VPAPIAPAGAAHPEETDLVLTWLEQPGVRLVELAGEWTCPVRSAQRVDAVTAVAIELAAPRGASVLPLDGTPSAVVPLGRVRADDGTRRTA
jgi:DNA polymerase-3 subunit epsilon